MTSSLQEVVIEFFAHVTAISGLVKNIFIFYTSIITLSWTSDRFCLLLLDFTTNSYCIFSISSICYYFPKFITLMTWKNMIKFCNENNSLIKFGYFGGLSQFWLGCIFIVQWFIPDVSRTSILTQLTIPTAILVSNSMRVYLHYL